MTSMCGITCTTPIDTAYLCFQHLLPFLLKCNTKCLVKKQQEGFPYFIEKRSMDVLTSPRMKQFKSLGCKRIFFDAEFDVFFFEKIRLRKTRE